MPYQIQWLIQDRVMIIHLLEEVSIEELRAMTNETFDMVRQSPHTVHAIADHTGVISLPKLPQMMTGVPRNEHPNQGITINIIPAMKRVNKFVTTTLMQIIGLEQRFANDLEEALQIIQRVDPEMHGQDLKALYPED